MFVYFYTDAGRYAVFDYHVHHGSLPFGPAAAVVATALWTAEFLVLPLVILLFPDGACRGAGGWCCGLISPTPPWWPLSSWAPPGGTSA